MSAFVIPFPLARRKMLVSRCARRMLEINELAAQHHLETLLRTQGETLRRKGVCGEVIQKELSAFEAAVRAMLWQRVFAPDGLA